jgi:uncharacterized RDD family membrane protein YckC
MVRTERADMSAIENSGQFWQADAAPAAGAAVTADWWRRFAALIIDVAVLWIPLGIATRSMDLGRYTGFAVGVAVGVTYFALLNGSRKGQTIGKMVWAIQVRDAETGGPLGYPKAAVRYLAPTALMLIPFLGFFLWVAEGFTPFMDSRRRALHDKVAGSVVVTAR